jgi:hypothetical protein
MPIKVLPHGGFAVIVPTERGYNAEYLDMTTAEHDMLMDRLCGQTTEREYELARAGLNQITARQPKPAPSRLTALLLWLVGAVEEADCAGKAMGGGK